MGFRSHPASVLSGLTVLLSCSLAMAQAHSDYVIVPCSASELDELCTVLEPQLRRLHESERRLVDRFLARVDAAALMIEGRTDEPPTVH